jgi:mannose-6-phosphate isomerase
LITSCIEPQFVERVWGSLQLEPWYPNPASRIGEVWFPAGTLLIKFLFTTEKLSVQVHPKDDYARRHHNGSAGKTEMWHVLRAEPGAAIAAGFRAAVAPAQARAAAVNGSIENLLQWHQARPGDTFFVPAGTVHALGAGLVVCEIQQMSDITYRLYDYRRQPARELHLERGFDVAEMISHPGPVAPVALGGGGARLAACSYFVTERWNIDGPRTWDSDSFLMGIAGSATIGDGKGRISPGGVWRVASGEFVRPDAKREEEAVVLRTYVPATTGQRT